MDQRTVDTLRTLSTNEVAVMLGCGRHHVEMLHNSHQLPFVKIAGKRRTLESDVLAFIRGGGDRFSDAAYHRNVKRYDRQEEAPV